ncbi:LacI family DNA-binding transcriptional regulator [Streptomyces sp. WAC00263]|uniref:LacI family DNA-binding transcriptional regulator n=1 Tax=Streptomyces sp. WAC00263 TaxID=1917422 RepID=UPI0015EF19FB|nr:LacI family DNA-binding transcriptional regulator [Streptomyces sp. WAC00263]KAF5995805.1 LacI family transcriptional regulator [Streptomyces sp. WAC00263]
MGYAESLGSYWRGRYKLAPGKYATVRDADGDAIRFRSKAAAKKAADAEEAKLLAGTKKAPRERITFGAYVNRWYAAQDLAASTMQNYRRHIEEHLLPAFEDSAVADILSTDIAAWEKHERAVPYAASSVKTWRATLHLILADAVDEGLRDSNPATKRRGRGKRAGRSRNRGPEKAVTTALGILLLAERMALLSGRDDEFVAGIVKGYTGMRWGEIVGLEPEFVRPKSIRVEWQLYELDTGELHRCPPKDDSYRDIDTPDFLASLLASHIARTRSKPCECHGLAYVFRGHGTANGSASRPGAKLVDVARRSGVSTGTVSNVLNRPDAVAEPTRLKVLEAVSDLGYIRNAASGELAAHWRRSGFATWLFRPAATGRYPGRGSQEERPVPVVAEPWPGIPARGRGASKRAGACWVPIAPGLTPHGLRHTHKTLMREVGTPPKLMDERMGHEDGSVRSRYDHITPGMRQSLMTALTGMWEEALDARRTMSLGSPVAALDAVLKAR